MAKLSFEERRRLAKCEPKAEVTTKPVRRFSSLAEPRPPEPDNWPHLTGYNSPQELWAVMDEHAEPDFAPTDEPRGCDWCCVDAAEHPRPAAWLCRRCNLAMCAPHFDFLILETDETFDRRFAQ